MAKLPKPKVIASALIPLSKADTLGTPEVASYEIAFATMPGVVQAAAGGPTSNRNNANKKNVFYTVTAGGAVIYAHYFRYRMTAKLPWTAGFDLYDSEGECIGNGECEDSGSVAWSFHY